MGRAGLAAANEVQSALEAEVAEDPRAAGFVSGEHARGESKTKEKRREGGLPGGRAENGRNHAIVAVRKQPTAQNPSHYDKKPATRSTGMSPWKKVRGQNNCASGKRNEWEIPPRNLAGKRTSGTPTEANWAGRGRGSSHPALLSGKGGCCVTVGYWGMSYYAGGDRIGGGGREVAPASAVRD